MIAAQQNVSELTLSINPKFAPIITDIESRYFIVNGGRGSAKSFSVSTLLITLLCEEGEGILYTRYTMVSAYKSIIPEFREKIGMLGMEDVFDITKYEIRNKQTGSFILFSGIKTSSGLQTGNLKSLTGITTWVVDEADEIPDEKIFQTIDDSIRIEGKQNRVILIFNPPLGDHWIYDRFFDPYGVTDEFNGVVDMFYSEIYGYSMKCRFISTTYEDNIDHLHIGTLVKIDAMKQTNYDKYLHIYRGHRMDKIDGALWTPGLIDGYRWKKPASSLPPMKVIVIGVDPAVKAVTDNDRRRIANLSDVQLDDEIRKMRRDLTGIVTAGLDYDNHFYVLNDLSMLESSNQWARAVVNEYLTTHASVIVYENNQGGSIIKDVIRNIDQSVNIDDVPAARAVREKGQEKYDAKYVRSIPVAGLYAEGRVHHVGYFNALERQMTTFTPEGNHASPNRLDALGLAITKLMEFQSGTGRRLSSPIVTGRTDRQTQYSRPNINFSDGSRTRPPRFFS